MLLVHAWFVCTASDCDTKTLISIVGMPPNDSIQVLAAAVTPVVLVSASAILISGTNSRYISLSDRIRALAHEYREPGCTDQRRTAISTEITVFQQRIHLVSWAVRALYMAVGAFITDALIISATLWRHMLAAATVPLFLLGILLIIAAIVCQLLELQTSNWTISVEISDVLARGRSASESGGSSLHQPNRDHGAVSRM